MFNSSSFCCIFVQFHERIENWSFTKVSLRICPSLRTVGHVPGLAFFHARTRSLNSDRQP